MSDEQNILTPEDIQARLAAIKLRKLEILQQELEDKRLLPHRNLFKHYRWSQDFYDDITTRLQVVCSGNQVSKSSAQIRKIIELSTNKELWKIAWAKKYKTMGESFVPNLFWFLYPDKKTADAEWRFKWKQFMPPRDHPKYGWKEETDSTGYISEIIWNSGVTIQFRFYSQDVHRLQSGSVFMLCVDEEPPWNLVTELLMRINATDGLFSAVFTATRGQDEWRRVIEPKPNEKRLLEDARVWQVSMWDCVLYADGTPSPWTPAEIRRVEQRCGTEKQIQQRVHGKFVKTEGLAVEAYGSHNRCDFAKLNEIDEKWPKFAAIDYGGGGTSHPSGIVFLAIRPDFKMGYIYKAWRGDGILTSAQDVINKYLEMRGSDYVWQVAYDWAAKDLATIAERVGLSIKRADKARESGFGTLNSLFKECMLWLPQIDPKDHMAGHDHYQFDKLSTELNSYSLQGTKEGDDLIDPLRYASALVPWQFDFASARNKIEQKQQSNPRRAGIDQTHNTFKDHFNEMQEWADLLDE